MTKAPKKTRHAAKQRYDARKTDAGEHIQVNVKFKTAADVRMWAKLRKRLDLSPSGIVRLAVKKLSEQSNE